MARELVPKICEIPADALPFLLMGVLVMWIRGWTAGRGGKFYESVVLEQVKLQLIEICNIWLEWKEFLNFSREKEGEK